MFISGVLGVKVKIMLPWDPTGKEGPKKPLPDNITILDPKNEELPTSASVQQMMPLPTPAAPAAAPVQAM